MIILGIESSCDDSSCAIVKDGSEILSCVTQDQVHIHAQFGGVVPELASRAHLHFFGVTLRQCLDKADLTMSQIDSIAITRGPGLLGSLLTGVMFARGLAIRYQKPLIPVHHILGHIYSVFLDNETPPVFPFLTLLVSGGHTYLISCKGHNDFEVLGETLDDSPGELFDKIARELKLGFPGGPVIAAEAKNGSVDRVPFPIPLKHRNGVDFSFSGLKSAVLREIKKADYATEDILASMENTIARFLHRQVKKAIKKTGFDTVVIAGGVSANRRLRDLFQQEFGHHFNIYFPPLDYAMDNGAMIASRAFFISDSSSIGPFDQFNAAPVIPLSPGIRKAGIGS